MKNLCLAVDPPNLFILFQSFCCCFAHGGISHTFPNPHPPLRLVRVACSAGDWVLVPLSAPSPEALRHQAAALCAHVTRSPDPWTDQTVAKDLPSDKDYFFLLKDFFGGRMTVVYLTTKVVQSFFV